MSNPNKFNKKNKTRYPSSNNLQEKQNLQLFNNNININNNLINLNVIKNGDDSFTYNCNNSAFLNDVNNRPNYRNNINNINLRPKYNSSTKKNQNRKVIIDNKKAPNELYNLQQFNHDMRHLDNYKK